MVALGQGSDADALIALGVAPVDMSAAFNERVRDEHPDWAGRTFTTGPVTPGEQLYTVSSADDVSAGLLQQLGLVLSPKVAALPASDTTGRASSSTARNPARTVTPPTLLTSPSSLP